MGRAMNIYDTLKSDHATVRGLLDRLVQFSESDQEGWKPIVDQIRDELIPHSRAEEALFYNAIRELDPESGVILHSYTEHAMAEADLRTLQAMKAIDVNWKTLARKLQKDILHHVQEEESRVFAAAQRLFNEEEATMISQAFEKLKPTVREQTIVGTSLDLVANLLPRRIAAIFQSKMAKAAESVGPSAPH